MLIPTKKYQPRDVENGDFNERRAEVCCRYCAGIDTTGLSQFLVQADRFGLATLLTGRSQRHLLSKTVSPIEWSVYQGWHNHQCKSRRSAITNFVSGRSGWRFGKNGTLETTVIAAAMGDWL